MHNQIKALIGLICAGFPEHRIHEPDLMESDQNYVESKGGHKSESNQHFSGYLKSKNFKESNQIKG